MLCFLTTFSQSLNFSCQWKDDYCTLNDKNQLRHLNICLALSRCFQDTFLYAVACLNGSFCPINMDFYDRHPLVNLKVFIHLGTCCSSHLQSTSQLPGPKKYLKKWIIVVLTGMSSCRSRAKTPLPRNSKTDWSQSQNSLLWSKSFHFCIEISLVNPGNCL